MAGFNQIRLLVLAITITGVFSQGISQPSRVEEPEQREFDIVLSVAAGQPQPIYKWEIDGQEGQIDGQEGQIDGKFVTSEGDTLTIQNPTSQSDDGVYQCFATNNSGTASSRKISLTVGRVENLGCWKDTSNRAIGSLEGKDNMLDGDYHTRRDAISKCRDAALFRGYSVFALQNGGWCASSVIAQDTYKKYGQADNCAEDGEGGAWANQVYKITNGPASDLENLGCWTDTINRAIPSLEGQDDRLDGSYQSRNDAIRKCKEAAVSRGFTTFAVQNGGWCASSADAEITYQKYGRSTNCAGDGEGGGWANQVYRITNNPARDTESNFQIEEESSDPLIVEEVGAANVINRLENLGCWKDTSKRAIGSLEGKDNMLDGDYHTRRDAIRKCRDAALLRGYSVFALQNGGWCASSVIAQDTYKKYGQADNCAEDGEGGAWANQVYRIQNAPYSDLENLGCWTDTINRAIPSLEGQDYRLDGSYHSRNDAIRKCKEAAVSRGFTIFAVQNGGWCASSADAEITYQKYGRSTNCAGDGEGGGWANQVYRITNSHNRDTESSVQIEEQGSEPLIFKEIGAANDTGLLENLGCWRDTSKRAIGSLEGKDNMLDGDYHTRRDAIRKCRDAALLRGYSVFALQNGGWCASSIIAQDSYKKYGQADNCAEDGKGGGWANQVYRMLNRPDSDLVNLGCWTDTINRAILSLEGQDDRLDGSYQSRNDAIRKCKEAAVSRGFTTFAVQNGGWCASSADAENTYQKYGRSTNCAGDGKGGGWANQVYRITNSHVVRSTESSVEIEELISDQLITKEIGDANVNEPLNSKNVGDTDNRETLSPREGYIRDSFKKCRWIFRGFSVSYPAYTEG
ncbi:uncharacterized protein [Ptychodera flava]|uniref:uncharacterized protein isoform X2 n=1 Tax=Ptychodera flava TaxID=63121 RepID=UPI003969C497